MGRGWLLGAAFIALVFVVSFAGAVHAFMTQ